MGPFEPAVDVSNERSMTTNPRWMEKRERHADQVLKEKPGRGTLGCLPQFKLEQLYASARVGEGATLP